MVTNSPNSTSWGFPKKLIYGHSKRRSIFSYFLNRNCINADMGMPLPPSIPIACQPVSGRIKSYAGAGAVAQRG